MQLTLRQPQVQRRQSALSTTGVIAALPFEARCLRRRLPVVRSAFQQNIAVAGIGWIRICGMGRVNAAQAASSLLQDGARRLLSWGVAGALTAELKAGALLVPDAIIADFGGEYRADSTWRGQIIRCVGEMKVRAGRLADSAHVLRTPVDKHALRARTGAVAVDMESAAIAAVAERAGAPFIAIRAIADEVGCAIPPIALDAIDDDGNLHARHLLRSLLRDPRPLPDLLRLACGTRAARATLTRVAALARDAL